MALPKLFEVNDDSPTADVALLIMRFLIGLTLFNFSGAPKLFHFSTQGDPLHLGGLAVPGMAFAAFALGLCTLLVLVGLATRYAALFTTISLAGTFFVIEHRLVTTNLLDPGHNSHPEVTYLYMVAFLALIFTGPGRYSLDRIFSKPSRNSRHATT
jgi:putative oxidoreductase